MPNRFDWRNLISSRDIGDIVGLVTSIRRLLARRSQKTADTFGRDVRRAETHLMDDVMTVMAHIRSIVDRKSREFAEEGPRSCHCRRHPDHGCGHVLADHHGHHSAGIHPRQNGQANAGTRIGDGVGELRSSALRDAVD